MRAVALLFGLLLCLTPIVSNAALLKSYGFEDWGGTVETTPDYPFGSAYSAFCDAHKAKTEVVTAYDGHNPHGGSYFLLLNMGTNAMSPTVTGITGDFSTGGYNSFAQGWALSTYCNNSTFDIRTEAADGILYVQMYAKVSGFTTGTTDTKLKALNFYNATTTDTTYYMNRDYSTSDPQIAIWSRYGDGTSSKYTYGATTDFDDGNWHKLAMYVDYSDGGDVYVWYDQDSPTLANADETQSVNAGYAFPEIDVLYLAENWSSIAATPTDAWVAIDDIEVWSSLPTVSADPTVTITAPTSDSTYQTDTTPITTIAGTASDDVSVSSVTWACPTCTPASGTATGTTTWSIASIGLASADNVITVTATDGDSNTGTDAITVTYPIPTFNGSGSLGPGSGRSVSGSGRSQ